MKHSSKDRSQSSSAKAVNSRTQDTGRLTIDAILAIINIVESMHKRISPLSSLQSAADKEQLSGISGLVYRNIRNVTQRLGKRIDPPLAVFT